MGRWGWRGGGQAEPREKLRVSRSGSYSDDYRITPELKQSDSYKNGHHKLHGSRGTQDEDCCSQDERCCSDADPCCSQDERYYHLEPSRVYKVKKGRSSSAEALRPRKGSIGGLEVVVVNEGRVDLHHQVPCTSCESCDTCRGDWENDSVTRIELKNNLFTSPMHTAEFYDSRESPFSYRQNSSPVRDRELSPFRGRSPQRRPNTSEGTDMRRGFPPNNNGRPSTVDEMRARPTNRLPRSRSNAQRTSFSPSRMPRTPNGSRAPNTRRNGRDGSRGHSSYRNNRHSKIGLDNSGSRLPAVGGSQSEMSDHSQEMNHYRKSAGEQDCKSVHVEAQLASSLIPAECSTCASSDLSQWVLGVTSMRGAWAGLWKCRPAQCSNQTTYTRKSRIMPDQTCPKDARVPSRPHSWQCHPLSHTTA
ncbi:uncharacterized protein LOC135198245 [Macrobrachium nipponense]|uniref:uncharacterized protein LOC135198245 n=1 Tax=Macrobrachium nipponense TaxID=159736 RepID=UPI0030C89FE5